MSFYKQWDFGTNKGFSLFNGLIRFRKWQDSVRFNLSLRSSGWIEWQRFGVYWG